MVGMLYHDSVHGTVTIQEPVLLDLLQTAALQRLSGVLQHGITGLIGVTRPTTRLEHSLGVMLLVRRLGGPLEEQIAALLHDVSHTAFSHVIDYVFGGHDSQGYHEDMKEEIVAGSDLPATLARHGYDWRDFLHEEAFPLLEQPAPALCADRLDYFMRDSPDLGVATPAEIQAVLDHLAVHAGRIVMADLSTARWMGYTFIAADQASWANFREVGLYELTARAIKTGLQAGVISDADIWTTDAALWAKLRASQDPALRSQIELISPRTQFVWDDADPTFRVSTKLRAIDPDVLMMTEGEGRCLPLSALDAAFARYRARYLADKSGLWPMRVIPWHSV
jgi:HD superfamily phosphohydrolase